MVEAKATKAEEPIETLAAPGGAWAVVLSADRVGKLREILNDTSIDRDERARVVSALIRGWAHEDQSDVEDAHEEEPRTAQEKGITGMCAEVLPPREEQREQELGLQQALVSPTEYKTGSCRFFQYRTFDPQEFGRLPPTNSILHFLIHYFLDH